MERREREGERLLQPASETSSTPRLNRTLPDRPWPDEGEDDEDEDDEGEDDEDQDDDDDALGDVRWGRSEPSVKEVRLAVAMATSGWPQLDLW